jgi:hypothetical protein
MTPAQTAHESGHATVGKHFGYKAEIINFDDHPRTNFIPPIWEMPEGLSMSAPSGAGCSRMPREHRLLIWAAGRAAMELMGSNDPRDGFADDRRNMEALDCSEEEIEIYVDKAKEIIKTNKSRWCAMRGKLDRRHGYGDQQALPQNEIDQIWDSI